MDPMTLVHLDDPAESRIAAINLSGTATEKVFHVIVDLLDAHGPMTPAELERMYFDHQGRWGWPQVAFYSIHRRVSQLKKHAGVLVSVGRRDGAQILGLADDARQAHIDITDYMSKDAS